jgi:hypothetical protein
MNSFHKKCTPLLIVLLFIGSSSCTNYTIPGDDQMDDALNILTPNCSDSKVTFEGDILSLLEENCIPCHNNSSAAGGYNYSDYDQILSSVADGSFLSSIEGQGNYTPMPPGDPLNDCSKSNLYSWIGTLDLEGVIIPVSNTEIEAPSTCDPDTVYFRNTILPLIVSSCGTTGCHDQDSHRDGIILTDYASIINTGKIKPGDPDDSEFFESLTDQEDDLMPPPPQSPLSQDQISLLEEWILQGANDNSCVEGCDTTNITFDATVWPIMQTYCMGCHTSGNPAGGIIIEDFDDLITLVQDGSLLGTIGHAPGYSAMPPNQPLDNCKIVQIRKWIEEGHPN